MVRVVIADDNVLIRSGVKILLDLEDGFEVAGLAGSYEELMQLVIAEPPDVVLTDIRMPPGSSNEGILAAVELGKTHPEVAVVVLSQYLEASYALQLFESGSSGRGYLWKEHVSDSTTLFDALRAVAGGGSYVDPAVVDAMVAVKRAQRSSPLERLTPREREVLAEVATGKSNAAIAGALFVSERAVEKHINSFFSKLGLTGDTDSHKRVKAVLLFLDEA